VLGSTLAQFNSLERCFLGAARPWQALPATVVAGAHMWFWWRALRCTWNLSVFHAVAIMLLFYGLVTGIVYARLPVYGINYLDELRYVSMYLLSNVDLVLMLLGQPLRDARRWLRAAA